MSLGSARPIPSWDDRPLPARDSYPLRLTSCQDVETVRQLDGPYVDLELRRSLRCRREARDEHNHQGQQSFHESSLADYEHLRLRGFRYVLYPDNLVVVPDGGGRARLHPLDLCSGPDFTFALARSFDRDHCIGQ